MKKRAIDVLGMLINCEAPLEIKGSSDSTQKRLIS
jgi:hypothetical protein